MDEKLISLGRLRVAAETLDARPTLIREARANKAAWVEITAALRMSRAAVIALSKK